MAEQLDQAGGHVSVHGHVERPVPQGGHDECVIARARSDDIAIDIDARLEPRHGQRARIRIVDVEADLKILLQDVATLILDLYNRQGGLLEMRRAGSEGRAGCQRD